MNKKFFNIIGSLVVIGFLFSGCEKDAEGNLFDAKGKDKYAVGSAVRTVEMVPADNNSFNVEIVRVDASSDANVNVTLELDKTVPAGTFQLKSSTVSFKAGEYSANATITYADINLLSPIVKYKMTLALSDDVLSPSKKGKMAITASRKLTYAPAGNSVIVSEAFGDTWEVETLKANEGDVYILKNLYDTGFDIQLVIMAGKATISGQAARRHNTYGNVYVRTSAPADVVGKQIDMVVEHYVPNLGSFGKFSESLTLP